jgi:integrase
MPRKSNPPKYRRHTQSGQAIVTLTDGFGGRRDVLLGKYGTAASRVEYARVIAEWEANGRRLRSVDAAADLTINELVLAFIRHAETYYRRPDGTTTGELRDYKLSLRPLVFLYGPTVAKDFDALALQAVRQLMLVGYNHPKYGPQAPLARKVINQRINRIRRMIRWGVSRKMLPGSVCHELDAVDGLKCGRSEARETAPVAPVHESVVNATLPFVRPQIAAMIRLQLLTGMRPGEVIVMRAIDLDTTSKVWLYRPGSDCGPVGQHKTAHHGHQKAIALGPQAQAIVKEWLRPNVTEYLFQPCEAMEALHAQRQAGRKTKVQPSQASRKRKARPKRKPRTRYSVSSYGKAILRGVEKANAARDENASEIPRWHPHQLRHTAATTLRREFGLDVARVVLGHRSPAITEVYAEADTAKAVEAMAKLG